VDMLALSLLGTSHLDYDYAGSDGGPPDAESLRRVVASVLGGMLR
jgi:hypothetical protein